MKQKAPAREPRPTGRPRKNPAEQPAQINQPMADPDLGQDQQPEQSNKKPINQNNNKAAMSMTKVSSKIHKPKLYDKTINDPIHDRQWRKAIEEELQNLENHQTCKYDELPLGQKAIRLK